MPATDSFPKAATDVRLRWSVRRQVTVLALLAVAAVLAVSAVVVVRVQRSQLLDNLDSSLAQRADDLEAIAGDRASVLPSSAVEVDRFVQILDPDGEVIASTVNVAGMLPALAPPVAGERIATVSDLPVEDDAFRVLVRRLSDGGALVVAENIDDVNDATGSLIGILVIAGLGMLVVLGALIWFVVGRTLRPVEAIRSEVDSIGGDELDRRVPVPGTDDEIHRLAVTMNEMLARVDHASTQQRQFVADASHELRSPLTRLRVALEVELEDPDPDLDSAAREALRETVAMQALVEDLLQLARSDAGAAVVRPQPVDLDDIVLGEARRLADSTGLQIDVRGVSAGPSQGDPRQLQRAIRNLGDNAARHAASRVAFAVEEQGSDGSIMVVVEDDGPGVPDVDLDRLFERFSRLDVARSVEAGGTGLGLAIVRDVVERHRGAVRATRSDLGGLRVELVFPPPSP